MAADFEEQEGKARGCQNHGGDKVEAVVPVAPVLPPGPVAELEAHLQEVDEGEEEVEGPEVLGLRHVVQVDHGLQDDPDHVRREHGVHEVVKERPLEAILVTEVWALRAVVHEPPQGGSKALPKRRVPPRHRVGRLQHVAHLVELPVGEKAVAVLVQRAEEQAQEVPVHARAQEAPEDLRDLQEGLETHDVLLLAVQLRWQQLLLHQLKGVVDAPHPGHAAGLHQLAHVLLVVAVDGGEGHLREDAHRQRQERQPQEDVEPTVAVGGHQHVREERRGHRREGGVQRVAEALEALVNRLAVGVELVKVVEDHGRDPGEDHNGAEEERRYLADGDQHPPEGVQDVPHPGQRGGKAEAHVGGNPEGRGRVGHEDARVAEPEDDHEVVKGQSLLLPVLAAAFPEGAVDLRYERDPQQDGDQQQDLEDRADARGQHGQPEHEDLRRRHAGLGRAPLHGALPRPVIGVAAVAPERRLEDREQQEADH
mmetsp:Transcript_61044/g.196677  ORF Transcript_61044/g.196677 Transcript_61044/m.196677 type:complete len:481 (-) Transcript_61044:247-1689(-)